MFCQVHAARQTGGDVGADGMHFGFDAGDQHLFVQRPQTHGRVFVQSAARRGRRSSLRALHIFGKMLTRIDRQLTARYEGLRGRAPRALRRVHTTGLGYRPFEHPARQRLAAQRLAGVDVLLNPLRHLQPTGFLPELERALFAAKAPAHRQINVARRLGNALQMNRRIVQLVAQNGPQKARLGAFGFAQKFQALAGRLFEHAADYIIGLGATGHIVHGLRVQAQDVAALFFVKACAGFLAQTFGLQQTGQHWRRGIERGKRVGVLAVAKIVLQGADHMRHGVQPHHIGCAESARARTAQFFAAQVIDHVVAQPEVFSLVHGGQHAGHTNAVGHKVGRVDCADDALAQRAGDKGFQRIEYVGAGTRGVDQFNQSHVARRVEKMNAAKARLDRFGQGLAHLGDRQARGVAGDDGVWRNERRDLFVERCLPVHALGNRLNDQVAALEQRQMLFVVGRLDQRRVFRHAQRCGLEFFQAFNGLDGDAAFGAF